VGCLSHFLVHFCTRVMHKPIVTPLICVDPNLFGVDTWDAVLAEFRNGGRLEGRWGFLHMLSKLSGPGEMITGPAQMARLYSEDGGAPLMTISAANKRSMVASTTLE